MFSLLSKFLASNWFSIIIYGIMASGIAYLVFDYTSTKKENINLRIEIQFKNEAIKNLNETVEKQKNLAAFSQSNSEKYAETIKNVDNNTSFLKNEIEKLPTMEYKERVLDEKSSITVIF